jgi:hypothetical protein
MSNKCKNCDSGIYCHDCGVCGECHTRKIWVLKEQIEQLQKENEESFRKGFWAGYEDARCFPDENNILQRYAALTENRNSNDQ